MATCPWCLRVIPGVSVSLSKGNLVQSSLQHPTSRPHCRLSSGQGLRKWKPYYTWGILRARWGRWGQLQILANKVQKYEYRYVFRKYTYIYFLTQTEHLILDWMDLVLMGKKCHKGYYVNWQNWIMKSRLNKSIILMSNLLKLLIVLWFSLFLGNIKWIV